MCKVTSFHDIKQKKHVYFLKRRELSFFSSIKSRKIVTFKGQYHRKDVSLSPIKNPTIMKRILLASAIALLAVVSIFAQKPDKNFHIFLCFGQSNMEAGAVLPNRTKTSTTHDSSSLQRSTCRACNVRWANGTQPLPPSVAKATT